MISLTDLHRLVEEFGADLAHEVRPLALASARPGGASEPLVMGVINLSRDSTYRASIAATYEAAVRRGRVLAAQGCDILDVGAESSTARARTVDAATQAGLLAPVIRTLAGGTAAVSVEARHPEVVRAGLEAGARVVNYTGREGEDEVFDLVAQHAATLVLCYVPGADVREVTDAPVDDAIPRLIDHFATRTARATGRGVTELAIDPGLGFFYGNLLDPMTRLRYQTRMLVQGFRLRVLGFPVCQALPHALELFEDRYRQAEAFFAVWATLARADVLRTHEVPDVLATVRSLRELDVLTSPDHEA